MGRFLSWWLKSIRNSGTNSRLEDEYTNSGTSDDASEIAPRRRRRYSTTATVGKPRSCSPNRTSFMSADPTPARTPPLSSSACSRSSRKKSSHNTSTEAVVEWRDQALRNSRNTNTTTSSVPRVSILLKKHKLSLVIPSPSTPVRAGGSPLSRAESAISEKADLLLGEELVLGLL